VFVCEQVGVGVEVCVCVCWGGGGGGVAGSISDVVSTAVPFPKWLAWQVAGFGPPQTRPFETLHLVLAARPPTYGEARLGHTHAHE
jgi:hypothetical protein